MDFVLLPTSTSGLGIHGETGFLRSLLCVCGFLLLFLAIALIGVISMRLSNCQSDLEALCFIVAIIIVPLLCAFLNKDIFSDNCGDIYICPPYAFNCATLIFSFIVVMVLIEITRYISTALTKLFKEYYILRSIMCVIACIIATLLHAHLLYWSQKKLSITCKQNDSLIELSRLIKEESVDGDYIIYCGTKFDELYYVSNKDNDGIYLEISLHASEIKCKLWQNGIEVDKIQIGSYVFYGFDNNGYPIVLDNASVLDNSVVGNASVLDKDLVSSDCVQQEESSILL